MSVHYKIVNTPNGAMYIILDPPDYGKIREDLRSITEEERIRAAISFMKARYMKSTRWQG